MLRRLKAQGCLVTVFTTGRGNAHGGSIIERSLPRSILGTIEAIANLTASEAPNGGASSGQQGVELAALCFFIERGESDKC